MFYLLASFVLLCGPSASELVKKCLCGAPTPVQALPRRSPTVVDPGFPRWRAPTSKVRVQTYYLIKFFLRTLKMKELKKSVYLQKLTFSPIPNFLEMYPLLSVQPGVTSIGVGSGYCNSRSSIQYLLNYRDVLSGYIRAVADLRGGARDARPPSPLWPKISSFSCSFRKKIGQIIGWRSPPLGLAPPPLGNPGSATALEHV